MKKYKHTAIVGIFDRFHEGHKFVIKEAFKNGETVHMLFLNTGDKFTHPDKTIDLVESFDKRQKAVKEFVDGLGEGDRIKYYGQKEWIGLPPVFGWSILRDCEELSCVQCMDDKPSYTPFVEAISYIRTHAYRVSPLVMIWIKVIKDENGNKVSSSKLRLAEEQCRVFNAR